MTVAEGVNAHLNVQVREGQSDRCFVHVGHARAVHTREGADVDQRIRGDRLEFPTVVVGLGHQFERCLCQEEGIVIASKNAHI